jgi:hypothetical protein
MNLGYFTFGSSRVINFFLKKFEYIGYFDIFFYIKKIQSVNKKKTIQASN